MLCDIRTVDAQAGHLNETELVPGGWGGGFYGGGASFNSPLLLILPLKEMQPGTVQRNFTGNGGIEKNPVLVRTKQSCPFLLHWLHACDKWFLPSPEPRMVHPTIQPAYPE